jgi:hypothetical protein
MRDVVGWREGGSLIDRRGGGTGGIWEEEGKGVEGGWDLGQEGE